MSDDENEPVHLVEDAETGDRFLVYGTDKGLRLDIRYEGETLWMTQAQMAQLFGVDRSVITKHIANVYAEGELNAEATSAKIAQVRQEGSRKVERRLEHYNLRKRRADEFSLPEASEKIVLAFLPPPPLAPRRAMT